MMLSGSQMPWESENSFLAIGSWIYWQIYFAMRVYSKVMQTCFGVEFSLQCISITGVCSNILFLLCGFDEAQLNETLLETIMHHTPAGASTHTILHYGQECYTGGFMNYDHQGDNVEYYGQPNTPPYDLSKVTVPTSIYWGQNDWFTVAEVIILKKMKLLKFIIILFL